MDDRKDALMNGNTWISTAVWGALDVVEGIYIGGPAL